jgi:hypothetical protein
LTFHVPYFVFPQADMMYRAVVWRVHFSLQYSVAIRSWMIVQLLVASVLSKLTRTCRGGRSVVGGCLMLFAFHFTCLEARRCV